MTSRNPARSAGSGISYLVFDPGRETAMPNDSYGFGLHLQDPFAVHAATYGASRTSHGSGCPPTPHHIRFINARWLSGPPADQACLLHHERTPRDLRAALLSAVCRHIKLARAGDLHDVIEDACSRW
jgi:hypothetical protein